jgi:hypothetical protein
VNPDDGLHRRSAHIRDSGLGSRRQRNLFTCLQREGRTAPSHQGSRYSRARLRRLAALTGCRWPGAGFSSRNYGQSALRALSS